MSKLHFHIHATKGQARAGTIILNGIEVPTPVFMPVGTKATIKGIILDMLQDSHYIGKTTPKINLILANTYHLFLRPGADIIEKAGGLHTYENRPGLILTDSGGFQAFSLGLRKNTSKQGKKTQEKKSLVKITKEGIFFRSIHDGTKHFMSPEDCVDIQCKLGSDIMMMLDVCSPAGISDKKVREHLRLTHHWAQRAYAHMQTKYNTVRGVLFPIVQGGTNLELRTQSATYLRQFATDGIAIGGVSVGESREQVERVIAHTTPLLPRDKPRYLMGVGDIQGIRYAIMQGVDMFDCVIPTRLGRHGIYYTDEGYKKITHAKNKTDFNPLTLNCDCYTCRNFTKSYLYHLWKEQEMLGGILLSLHNIVWLQKFTWKIREEILAAV